MQQKAILTETQINYCMECGVCTASCPVSRHLTTFSPRQIIKRSMNDDGGPLPKEIFACLTCGRCSVRCPVGIDFPEFARHVRANALEAGVLPLESHHGIFQTIAQMHTMGLSQRRTAWAEGVGAHAETGDVLLFVGCLPYFEPVFGYLALSSLEMAKSALRLLNRLGITPALRYDECCCGHDALYSGKTDTFVRLAERNLRMVEASGARTVLFICPEGYLTFKQHYPEHLGPLPFEVMHLSEFLATKLPGASLAFSENGKGPVTFHDPCRLGRLSGIYEAPRALLNLVPGRPLVEMGRTRENALCCGTTAWMECSESSKAIRVERLQEAMQTGAGTLVTACPKCMIHFTCTSRADALSIEIQDLYAYLLSAMP